jgi:hypothetical protein
MSGSLSGFQPQARAQAEAMLHGIASAEQIIVSAIERECEALRTGRMLAAKALHTQLRDAARIYLNATRAARASIVAIERLSPGICDRLEERRAAFASLLKVELAVLAAERAAIFENDRTEAGRNLQGKTGQGIDASRRATAVPRPVAIGGDAPRTRSGGKLG